MRQIILVCGYPRSGNIWLCRLLGDALNSPVQGMPGWELGSLASEGQDRPGRYRIIQSHQPPDYRGKFSDEEIAQRKMIVITRHPFDVAVSAAFFWDMPLDEVIGKMADGGWPFEGFPSWVEYHRKYASMADVLIRYEDLHTDPANELSRVIGDGINNDLLNEVIGRQTINAKRRIITVHPQEYSFTLEEQLHHLRKGIVGDWRNRFNDNQIKLAGGIFGEMMAVLGYDYQPV